MFEIPAVFVDPSAGTTIDVVVALRLRRCEIVASAECGPIRTQDHAMHRSVIVGFPERIDEFREQSRREWVASLRLVQRDPRAAAVHFIEEVFVGTLGHRETP